MTATAHTGESITTTPADFDPHQKKSHNRLFVALGVGAVSLLALAGAAVAVLKGGSESKIGSTEARANAPVALGEGLSQGVLPGNAILEGFTTPSGEALPEIVLSDSDDPKEAIGQLLKNYRHSMVFAPQRQVSETYADNVWYDNQGQDTRTPAYTKPGEGYRDYMVTYPDTTIEDTVEVIDHVREGAGTEATWQILADVKTTISNEGDGTFTSNPRYHFTLKQRAVELIDEYGVKTGEVAMGWFVVTKPEANGQTSL